MLDFDIRGMPLLFEQKLTTIAGVIGLGFEARIFAQLPVPMEQDIALTAEVFTAHDTMHVNRISFSGAC